MKKRASGEREREQEYRQQTANQPHRRGVWEEYRLYQEAGSVLGRLWLSKAIERNEYDAGEEYRRRYARYRVTNAGPINPASGNGAHECDPDACLAGAECSCRKAKVAYKELRDCLDIFRDSRQTQAIVWMVERTCCQDEEPFDVKGLQTGLRAIARFLA